MQLTQLPLQNEATTSGLTALIALAAPLLPLPALSPQAYARGHALFEARSDQRALLTTWLCRLLAARAGSPTRVLSIGCGDGTVDAALARVLAQRGRLVTYDGIEPNVESGRAFLAKLRRVPGVACSVTTSPFDRQAAPREAYDVVLAVHSLYYVPDLKDALVTARELVAPGGLLIVLHAPLGALNQLVAVLAAGQGQEFSGAVSAALQRQRRPVRHERLHATLDLTSSGNDTEDREVLDFIVQVQVPVGLRAGVMEVLRRAARGPGMHLAHPLDTFVVAAPPT